MNRRAAAAALVAVAGGALFCATGGAAAQSDQTIARAVSATASAEGTRLSVAVPGYLLVDKPVDSGGPVAQAVYETFGARTAFAATPYPGELVTSLPGLAQAFGAPAVPVNYPLIATADDPSTPNAELSDPTGTYVLKAQANGTGTTSSSVVSPGPLRGGPGIRTSAGTTVDADGTVKAIATTSADGIVIAGLLDLGVVRATTSAVLAPGARTPKVVRKLDIAGAAVGGVPVSIGDHGVVAAGTGYGSVTDPAQSAVNAALTGAELEVRLVKGTDLKGGTTGNVLEIRSLRNLPLPGNPRGTVSLVIGGASVSIVSGAQDAGSGFTVPIAVGGGASPANASGDGGTSAPSAGASSLVPVAAGATRAERLPATGGRALRSRTSALAPFDFDHGFHIFFLVMALGGTAMVVASWRTRTPTVRTGPWIS